MMNGQVLKGQNAAERGVFCWQKSFAAIAMAMMVCTWSMPCLAQNPTGQILGKVLDPQGLAVPDAEVVALNLAMGTKVSQTSSESGDFILRGLLPGTYEVSAQKSGFKKTLHSNISVSALQNARLDLTLELGAISDSVTVTDNASLVDSHASTLGSVVDDRRIVDLPVNGRNVYSLVAVVPGVNRLELQTQANRRGARLSINGNRVTATNVQLDGGTMDVNYQGDSMPMPPPDAVQEIKIVASGVTADYGRGTAVVSMVTKSGTNQFHGSLWEYFRNDALDARNFFTPKKGKLRYNQFGGTLGGRVIKDKLFFFGCYQGLRWNKDSSNTSVPPTDLERAGNFSASKQKPKDPSTNQPFPGGIIPSNRFDAVAMKYLAMVPNANTPQGKYIAQAAEPQSTNDYLTKVDWYASPKDILSFRLFHDKQNLHSAFPALSGAFSSVPTYSPSDLYLRARTYTLNYTRVWTAKISSITRATYATFEFGEVNSNQTTLEQMGAKNFPMASDIPRPPSLEVSGYFKLSPAKNSDRQAPSIDIAQDWSMLHGRHDLKWGGQFLRQNYNIEIDQASSGQFTFDGTITGNAFADFMLGRSVSFQQNSNHYTTGHSYQPAFYVQDNIKVGKRLTFNLGVRYEAYTPWREIHGQGATFIAGAQSKTFPTAPRGAIYQDDPEYNYHTDSLNIGPRIGFAWDVFGDGKAAVRGGFATSFDKVPSVLRLQWNQPFVLDFTNTNPGPLSNPYANIPNPFPYKVDPATAKFVTPMNFSTLPIIGKNLQATYSNNVNLTVERQLKDNWLVQLSYLGSFGRKLLNYQEQNPAVYIPGNSTTANTNARRIYGPNFGAMASLESAGTSSYNAMQAQVQKRFSHGLSFQAHYTWSKSIDASGSVIEEVTYSQQDPYNRNGSRARNDADRTHILGFSYIYELPFMKESSQRFLRGVLGGWKISGMNRFMSGVPFSVMTGRDISLTGVNLDRPNLIGKPSWGNGTRDQQINQWFDTSVFAQNDAGKYGNAGRNIIRGPGFVQFDVSLQKRFRALREHFIEFRVDAFSVLNRPNFGNPGNSLLSPTTFGKITSASGARTMQFCLRYEF